MNHKDEIKEHNFVSNLEWMTREDNVRYGTGLERSAKTRSKKVYCAEKDKYYDSLTEAAKEPGITISGLSYALNHSGVYKNEHWRYAESICD